MNFFKRRKILKSTSFTDLTPIKLMQAEPDENGNLKLMVPKFKNVFLRRYFIPYWKSSHFKIHLDETGTAVWIEIDGEKSAGEICERLKLVLGEKIQPHDEVVDRVAKFLSRLYEQRYITFREIL